MELLIETNRTGDKRCNGDEVSNMVKEERGARQRGMWYESWVARLILTLVRSFQYKHHYSSTYHATRDEETFCVQASFLYHQLETLTSQHGSSTWSNKATSMPIKRRDCHMKPDLHDQCNVYKARERFKKHEVSMPWTHRGSGVKNLNGLSLRDFFLQWAPVLSI